MPMSARPSSSQLGIGLVEGVWLTSFLPDFFFLTVLPIDIISYPSLAAFSNRDEGVSGPLHRCSDSNLGSAPYHLPRQIGRCGGSQRRFPVRHLRPARRSVETPLDPGG